MKEEYQQIQFGAIVAIISFRIRLKHPNSSVMTYDVITEQSPKQHVLMAFSHWIEQVCWWSEDVPENGEIVGRSDTDKIRAYGN